MEYRVAKKSVKFNYLCYMILYNLTLLTDQEVHEDLKAWIQNEFFAIATLDELFTSKALLKVLNSPNEGVTYSLQLVSEKEANIIEFKQHILPFLHVKVEKEWLNRVYFFESLLEFQ